MSAIAILVFGLTLFFVGAKFYSKFLAQKIFRLDPSFKTPAHQFKDGVDFVPTSRHVLFGHHFTSVAGAAPILGPAIAIIWGWVPALIWVVFGTILAGAVHDFGTLWVSGRHGGQSIGSLTGRIVSSRARILFLLVIFFLVVMVNAVFAMAIANLFIKYPGTVIPINIEIPLAILIGYLVYKKRQKIFWPSVIALLALYFFVWVGSYIPVTLPGDEWTQRITWIILLLAYGFIAASLPVWTLLQPRDYINSHQLFVGLGILYVGVILLNPEITAPQYNPDAPTSWFPLLFITIACGAISGFHGLVSSGTTSKQLNKETDARYVGYGGAIGEGSLALMSILACVAAFGTSGEWKAFYGSGIGVGQAIQAFVTGGAKFAAAWGIPEDIGQIFIGVMIISFAATSLDTSIRILKYVISEIGKQYQIKILQKGWLAALIGVVISGFLVLHDGEGKGGLLIWPLFGTTNQLMAGLSLLVVSLYLKYSRRPVVYVIIPMIFLLAMTSISMVIQLKTYFVKESYLLFVVGGIILILELLVILEAIFALSSTGKGKRDEPAEEVR
ncbi:MAG: carbon starvation protein A [Spirochaetota bacterium]|nr:carbon starvation protein A [Spirochaetota bacterium]